MKVKVIGNWSSAKLGSFDAGQVIDLPDDLAENFEKREYVTRYETKVVHEVPLDGGLESVATSSRPVRRRKTTTSKKSEGEEE